MRRCPQTTLDLHVRNLTEMRQLSFELSLSGVIVAEMQSPSQPSTVTTTSFWTSSTGQLEQAETTQRSLALTKTEHREKTLARLHRRHFQPSPPHATEGNLFLIENVRE